MLNAAPGTEWSYLAVRHQHFALPLKSGSFGVGG